MTTRLLRVAGVGILALGIHASAADRTPPTFAADIAPIVNNHCASCHRPGQAAPFSLLS